MLSLVDFKKTFIGNIFKFRRVINLPWGRTMCSKKTVLTFIGYKQTNKQNKLTDNADIKIARHVLFSFLNT